MNYMSIFFLNLLLSFSIYCTRGQVKCNLGSRIICNLIRNTPNNKAVILRTNNNLGQIFQSEIQIGLQTNGHSVSANTQFNQQNGNSIINSNNNLWLGNSNQQQVNSQQANNVNPVIITPFPSNTKPSTMMNSVLPLFASSNPQANDIIWSWMDNSLSPALSIFPPNQNNLQNSLSNSMASLNNIMSKLINDSFISPQNPTFQNPTSLNPIFQSPVSQNSIPQNPVFQSPISQNPISQSPVSQNPTPQNPVSQSAISQNPTSLNPTSQNSIFTSPTSQNPVSSNPILQNPNTIFTNNQNDTLSLPDIEFVSQIDMGFHHEAGWHITHCLQVPYFDSTRNNKNCISKSGWFFDIPSMSCERVDVPCGDIATLNFWFKKSGCAVNCTMNGQDVKVMPTDINLDPRKICILPLIKSQNQSCQSNQFQDVWTYDANTAICYEVKVDCTYTLSQNNYLTGNICQHFCHNIGLPGTNNGHHLD